MSQPIIIEDLDTPYNLRLDTGGCLHSSAVIHCNASRNSCETCLIFKHALFDAFWERWQKC